MIMNILKYLLPVVAFILLVIPNGNYIYNTKGNAFHEKFPLRGRLIIICGLFTMLGTFYVSWSAIRDYGQLLETIKKPILANSDFHFSMTVMCHANQLLENFGGDALTYQPPANLNLFGFIKGDEKSGNDNVFIKAYWKLQPKVKEHRGRNPYRKWMYTSQNIVMENLHQYTHFDDLQGKIIEFSIPHQYLPKKSMFSLSLYIQGRFYSSDSEKFDAGDNIVIFTL